MDKFPLSRSNPWEHCLASNETGAGTTWPCGFLKQGQSPPEQKHWVRAISTSTVPHASPQHTCPIRRTGLPATKSSLPPQHSSTVTPTTAELLGSQAVCHGQMPTCRYLETPVPPSINSQAPHPPASSDALLSAPCPGPYPPEYLALAGSHQAVRFLLTSQPEEHHGVTVSSDRSPQHASPEVSVRTLRGCKDYREAQKYMRALETREGVWMRT